MLLASILSRYTQQAITAPLYLDKSSLLYTFLLDTIFLSPRSICVHISSFTVMLHSPSFSIHKYSSQSFCLKLDNSVCIKGLFSSINLAPFWSRVVCISLLNFFLKFSSSFIKSIIVTYIIFSLKFEYRAIQISQLNQPINFISCTSAICIFCKRKHPIRAFGRCVKRTP